MVSTLRQMVESSGILEIKIAIVLATMEYTLTLNGYRLTDILITTPATRL